MSSSSVYTEQQKLLLSLKKSLTLTNIDDDDITEINIPPRKLLSRRSFPGDIFSSDEDPYSSDHFRMFEFKIRRCNRSRSHDWTDCPFAHPGEKARRRDPRRYQYSGEVCPEYRRGSCSRGDSCEFSHGVFECWLHPARYRTEACKDGKNCKRKVCFFAHTQRQLRVLPLSPQNNNNNNCCSFCHHHCCSNSNSNSNSCSPTSTLFSGVSSNFSSSPPLSPSSPAPSRFVGPGNGNTKDMHVLKELMCSLNFGEKMMNSPSKLGSSSFGSSEDYNNNLQFYEQDTPGRYCSNSNEKMRRNKVVAVDDDDDDVIAAATGTGTGTGTAPDLGWVNELLM